MSDYYSTGNGGWFFRNIYDETYSLETIRKIPCSIEEFSAAGLSSQEIDEYFLLIKQLYGELYLERYMLLPTKGVKSNASDVWKRLNDFCLQHSLVPEFSNECGMHPEAYLPSELRLFNFICTEELLPGEIYTATFDDFRLVAEYCLAELTYDWYLSLRYNVNIRFSTNGDENKKMLIRYDSYANEMVLLSENEVSFLQRKIQQDLTDCERRTFIHNRNIPKRPINSTDLHDRLDWQSKCQEWYRTGIALQYENDALVDCGDIISDIVESGVHNGIRNDYPDDTLYVYKGQIKCQRDKHRINQATAILMNRNGRDIELNVSHCLDCNKFFIHYDIYKRYREQFGCLLGNIRMAKNGEFYGIGYDLAEESPLRLCGYSVSPKYGLSQRERQNIIASCIESGGMTKDAVIRLLRWFVEVNGKKKGNEIAFKKWCEDLDFALAYNTSKQEKFIIQKIEHYSRNRFVCNT